MRSSAILLLASSAAAQSVVYVYTATFTQTAIEYVNFTTCPCPPTTTAVSTLLTTTSPIQTILPITAMSTSGGGILLPSDTIAPLSPIPTTTPGTVASDGSVPASSSTSPGGSVVTNAAYINTILVHHNIHRSNHSADPLIWNTNLAEDARQIAETCAYAHSTSVGGGGYGQNIGAGYPSTPLGMGSFVTEGLYNGEVNNYIYYGGEPDTSTLGEWGHFSQIVWKGTSSVGCYTADCSANGLANTGGGIAPYFTVCNYAPPGNVVGYFAPNVGTPLGLPTVYGDYQVPV